MQNGKQLIEDCLDEPLKKASEELSVYLIESVGNETRIDYGTGKYTGYSKNLKIKNINFFLKCSLIQNKFGAHWIQIREPIYMIYLNLNCL